jgi:hypothetical protein
LIQLIYGVMAESKTKANEKWFIIFLSLFFEYSNNALQ